MARGASRTHSLTSSLHPFIPLMAQGFVVRCVALVAACLIAVVVWRIMRPSRAHVLCAIPAALFGAFGDWWVEVLIYRAGVWEHTGRVDAFSVLGVPMEMPLTFVPAGLAGLWLLGLGGRMGSAHPAGVAALLYAGWCTLGIASDAVNLSIGISMHTDLPLAEVVPLYVVPFWLLISATAPFVYWLGLQVKSPQLSVLDVGQTGIPRR